MSFFDNITFRNKRSQEQVDIMDKTNSSKFSNDDSHLPDTSIDDVIELKEQLKNLTCTLKEAQQQIKNLTLENSALTNNIYELAKQNELYRKINMDCTPKKKNKQKLSNADTPLQTGLNNTPKQALTPRNVCSKETQTELPAPMQKNALVEEKPRDKMCIISSNNYNNNYNNKNC